MKQSVVTRVASGAVAGLLGTVLIQALQLAGQKLAPSQMPPIRQHPGEYMVQRAEEVLPAQLAEKVPEKLEKVAAQALGMGYGVTFGLLYAAARPQGRHVFLEGSALGIAAWATGYLGWLPATRLMPPITRQTPAQVLGAIASHLAYGVTTAAAYRSLRRR